MRTACTLQHQSQTSLLRICQACAQTSSSGMQLLCSRLLVISQDSPIADTQALLLRSLHGSRLAFKPVTDPESLLLPVPQLTAPATAALPAPAPQPAADIFAHSLLMPDRHMLDVASAAEDAMTAGVCFLLFFRDMPAACSGHDCT